MPEAIYPSKRPRNERLANAVLNNIVSRLSDNLFFEELSLAGNEFEDIMVCGEIRVNTRHSFEISYTIESRGSPLGMIYTQVIAGGREDNGRIRLNYGEFEILPPPRERVA